MRVSALCHTTALPVQKIRAYPMSLPFSITFEETPSLKCYWSYQTKGSKVFAIVFSTSHLVGTTVQSQVSIFLICKTSHW